MSEFNFGDAVWVKIGTFPWWPARVENPDDLPQYAKKVQPKGKNAYAVYFFGTKEFAWPTATHIKDFKTHEEEFSLKCKRKDFKKALLEIRDRESWPKQGSFKDAEDPSEVLAEPEEEEVEEKKPTKKRAKRDQEYTPKEKKQKVRRKSKALEPLSERKQLFRLRTYLQKFLQHEGEYTQQDYEQANTYLSEAETVKMNIELFKETKLGKVVKHLAKKEIEAFQIGKRCKELTDIWMKQLQEGLKAQEQNNESNTENLNSLPNEDLVADSKVDTPFDSAEGDSNQLVSPKNIELEPSPTENEITSPSSPAKQKKNNNFKDTVNSKVAVALEEAN